MLPIKELCIFKRLFLKLKKPSRIIGKAFYISLSWDHRVAYTI
jgi:hypothetical protein